MKPRKLSEIAEYIIRKYPEKYANSCLELNNSIKIDCREDWYEDYLIDEMMDFFSIEVVGMYGYGIPEYTYEFIRRLLNIRLAYQDRGIDYSSVRWLYKKDLKLDMNDDEHYGILSFILYTLRSCGIVEYDSNVFNCRLTELGEMYSIVLNTWYDREIRRINNDNVRRMNTWQS